MIKCYTNLLLLLHPYSKEALLTSKKFLASILDQSSCLYHLLSQQRDIVVTSRLCSAFKFPVPLVRSGQITFSRFLWPPCVADADIIFLSCGLFCLLLSFFLSSPNVSRRRLDVYHTSTHSVPLVRI